MPLNFNQEKNYYSRLKIQQIIDQYHNLQTLQLCQDKIHRQQKGSNTLIQ